MHKDRLKKCYLSSVLKANASNQIYKLAILDSFILEMEQLDAINSNVFLMKIKILLELMSLLPQSDILLLVMPLIEEKLLSYQD